MHGTRLGGNLAVQDRRAGILATHTTANLVRVLRGNDTGEEGAVGVTYREGLTGPVLA